MEKERSQRTRMLIGEENFKKLEECKVMVIGLGGVGGYTVEALSRAGVGSLILVDFDTVSLSNINRQIIANTNTVGMKKTEAFKDRIFQINPECKVSLEDMFVTKENAASLIEKYNPDFVVDAIDNVSAKIAIAEYVYKNGIKAVASMGTGNKLDMTKFKICDIKKTAVCPLARVMRKELKDRGVESYTVLYSEEVPVKVKSEGPSSISFVPSAAGLLLSQYVITELISR